MKIIALLGKWITLGMLILAASAGFAQQAQISGRVIDSEQEEAIEGASVEIARLGIGAITEADGTYTLPDVPQGEWLLEISFVGYSVNTRKVVVMAGEHLAVNVELHPSDASLKAVVITGQAEASLIRENSIPAAVVSRETIERTIQPNIIDALSQATPGFYAVKTGPNISKPFIRGLGYNRVLTLYDGIRQEGQQWGEEHGLEIDSYNISNAEIIMGPASIMYGSDAVAGVVSLFSSEDPAHDSKLHGQILSEYQSNNGLIGNGAQIAYAGKRWSYALRGSSRIAKNYHNRVDGPVYNTGFKETNLSAKLKRVSKFGSSDLNFTLYNDLQGIPDGSRDSLSRRFTKQVLEGDEDDLRRRPIVTDKELFSYELSRLRQHIQHYRIYSNNVYKVGGGELNGVLAYQHNRRREFNHPSVPEQPGLFLVLQTANYGLRYNLPKIFNILFAVGFNGMYQNNASKDATDFPIPDYQLTDIGGYAFAKWKKNRWTLNGGFRQDFRFLHGNDFYIGAVEGTEFVKHLSYRPGAHLQFQKFDKTFKGTSFSVGAAFKINHNLYIKSNISRGYRAPNMTEFASNGLDPGAHIIYLGNRDFNPEFSLQEDVGIDFAHKSLHASVRFFNNNIKNYIYLSQLANANGETVTDAQGNKAYQYQQGSAQLYGLETSVSMRPKFIKGFLFDNAISVTYGINKDEKYKYAGVNGHYLPFIPPLRWLSSIKQNIPFKSNLFKEVSVNLSMEYAGAQNRYLAIDNTETYTPSYALVNAGVYASIRIGKTQSLQFQFQINNLFDKAYQSNLSRLKYFEYYSKSPNGTSGIYGMGRNISFRLIYVF